MITVVCEQLPVIFRKTIRTMRVGHLLGYAFFSLVTGNGMAQVADAGPDQYICGDTTFLQGNLPGVGQSGSWSVFAGTGVFADATLATTQVTGLTFGDNELVWTLTDGMTTTTDTVLITAYDPAAPPAIAAGDTTIFGPPFNAVLIANSPYFPQSCSWTVVAGTATIAQPNQSTTSATGLNVGGTTFQWACDNGPCGITTWTLTVYMWFATGIDPIDAHAPFFIDPSTGALVMISYERVSDLKIFDTDGRESSSPKNTALPNGIYIVHAVIGGEVFTQRFIVSR